MKEIKEKRDMVVTIRFTPKEMELMSERIKERNKNLPKEEHLTMSEYIREKLCVLDKSLELKQIRMELKDLDTQMKQIKMYLSRKGTDANESFVSEVLASIGDHLGEICSAFETEETDGSNST